MTQRKTNRYAVYWAPRPESPLAVFGNAWLGRCPSGGAVAPRPKLEGFDAAEITALLSSPVRYGFHGTLKPPFRLAGGNDESDLLAGVEALASRSRPVALSSLVVREIGRFIALVPDPAPPALSDLADACVRDLDQFRAPATDEELARRRQAGLRDRQEELLMRWGYPYVMDEFRFHLTLTGKVPDERRGDLLRQLHTVTAKVLGPARIEDLCVFVEPSSGAPFRLAARFPLSGE